MGYLNLRDSLLLLLCLHLLLALLIPLATSDIASEKI
jgi:hypothetical protein